MTKSKRRKVQVLIVADTHGVLDPRIAELASTCDYAAHAGDIGGIGVLRALTPRRKLVAVRGNNDVPGKWPNDEANFLQMLPDEAALMLPGGELVIVHGHRGGAHSRHQRLRQTYPAARAIVYGHSHRLLCDQSEEPWVLNPGAAGRARTFGGPSCLILQVADRQWAVERLRFPLPARKRSRAAV